MAFTLFSPAKVNLFLRVLHLRQDGYREIASLFQTISLGDDLVFRKNGSHDQLTTDEPTLPCDTHNLIWKALMLFRSRVKKDFSVSIHLVKRIPIGAGLGGGSSNAATALWGLNLLHGKPVPEETLRNWAAELGSDVPFFFSQGTAYCTGRGEIVESYPTLSLNIEKQWIVQPRERLATAEVYKCWHPDQSALDSPEELLASFYKGKPIYRNDLEKPASLLLPRLSSYKKELQKLGLSPVMLTGSGTAFFCKGNPSYFPSDFSFFSVDFISREREDWYQFIN
jgi:4-diphosphocytidyl-2-C-methyl-D-erythritol kinase